MPTATAPSPSPAPEAAPPTPGAATGRLRRLGQWLALPIAAMLTAGLLLRLGQDDLLGRFDSWHQAAAMLSAAGGAVLDYLPLLFAVGIALGTARGRTIVDAAGPVLAALISYLVMARTILVYHPMDANDATAMAPARWPYGALTGILAGCLAVVVWRGAVERRRLPAFAGYAVVLATALACGWLLSLAYPWVDRGLTGFAEAIASNAVVGGGLFGVINRVLLPIGLHHIPNALVWFVAGRCESGATGDIPCFFAHDPQAGVFMSGFFPVAIFGLPVAALAMWHSTPRDRRDVGSLLLSGALLSAAFGITEPLELSFAFTAMPLYLVHALLTGLSLALANVLGVHAGFFFSAGLLDLSFNWSISTRPAVLLALGAVYAVIYYALFRSVIARFDLHTPGRAPSPGAATPTPPSPADDLPGPATNAPAGRTTPMSREVMAACYGIGSIFPVVIIDGRHRWAAATYPGLPAPQPDDGHGMLVLRWTAPSS
ncbi:PTS transporter subunit EIIC [Streptomyces sp. NPDC091416]|uniref:PTS transporter subunit EIIC n=1 Tax=Streptomyces sp. NPDC091416 TaxID=3366003 RepID=UPI0037F7CC0F